MSQSAQIEYWNGPAGQRWTAHQGRLDHAFAAINARALEVLAPATGEKILDVGCGAGTSCLALADAVGPTGRVVGLDVSKPLVAMAQHRLAQRPEVDVRLQDAATAQLDTDFDALFSRFGVMFFDDPVPAFSHLGQALKPGGRLAFVCWQALENNPWVQRLLEAGAGIVDPLPPFPAPGQPGPFAFADKSFVVDLLDRSGFTEASVLPLDLPVELSAAGPDDAVEFALTAGAAAKLVAGQPLAIRNQVVERLVQLMRSAAVEHTVQLPGSAWMVTARRP